MRALALAVLIAAGPLAGDAAAYEPKPDPYCPTWYTRAHFHAAARSTYRTAFPPARKLRTLRKIVTCQRRPASRRIVRRHLHRYRVAWARRFWLVHYWAGVPAWLKGTLERIAYCETGGTMNPAAVSPGGKYRGLFQFDYGTWATAGGSGDPAAAPPLEQRVRAAILYRRRGAAPWPVCGR